MTEDWDNYRYFLAVVREGSYSAAARALGVSQPTVSRRIALLEDNLGARLFEQGREGLITTEPGSKIVDHAERIQETALRLRHEVEGFEDAASGPLTLTTVEGLATTWLIPRLAKFKQLFPNISVTLIVTGEMVDIMRGEADLALRFGELKSSDLIARRIAKPIAGIYASKGYIADHGLPESLSDLKRHKLIEMTGECGRFPQCAWLNQLMATSPRGARSDNAFAGLEFANAGLGLVASMAYMTTGKPDLVRLLPDEFEVQMDLWMVSHPDLQASSRMRLLKEFLTAEATRNQSLQ
jgi:DNA-binding transcriptional LysR family regulator